MNQKLLRPVEAALLLGISRSLLYLMLMRGEIPSITIHKARRIPAEALDAFIQDRLAEGQVEQRVVYEPPALARSGPTSRRSRRTAR
jgi:excisionase family DNA binding protein